MHLFSLRREDPWDLLAGQLSLLEEIAKVVLYPIYAAVCTHACTHPPNTYTHRERKDESWFGGSTRVLAHNHCNSTSGNLTRFSCLCRHRYAYMHTACM